jgi:hypothetical protein
MNHPERKFIQSGQAIVIVTLGMIGFLSFMVLAVDGARFLDQRRIAQTAADMSALAGLRLWKVTTGIKQDAILKSVDDLAQTNGIADTDGDSGNGINGNVQAWFINGDGNYVDASSSDGSGTEISGPYDDQNPPSAALVRPAADDPPIAGYGLKVRVQLPYVTFMGHLIGQRNLTAQADSVAKLTVFYTADESDDAIYVAGSECSTMDNLAFNFEDINNTHFYSSVTDNGSLCVGSYNPATTFDKNLYVRVITGTKRNRTGGNTGVPLVCDPISPANSDPFTRRNYSAGARYIPPDNAALPIDDNGNPRNFLKWAYMDWHDIRTLIDAESFRPTSGAWYKFYQANYTDTTLFGSGAPDAATFFVDVSTYSGTTMEDKVNAAYAAAGGAKHILFIDGDLTINANAATYTNVTFIVTGRVKWLGNSGSITNAGLGARNISILAGAGKTYSQSDRCARNYLTAAMAIGGDSGGNQFIYNGVMYTPYGQTWWNANYRADSDPLGPIITYSLNIGGGPHPANSQQFKFQSSLLQLPTLNVGMQK